MRIFKAPGVIYSNLKPKFRSTQLGWQVARESHLGFKPSLTYFPPTMVTQNLFSNFIYKAPQSPGQVSTCSTRNKLLLFLKVTISEYDSAAICQILIWLLSLVFLFYSFAFYTEPHKVVYKTFQRTHVNYVSSKFGLEPFHCYVTTMFLHISAESIQKGCLLAAASHDA